MRAVSASEARARFGELLDAVEDGEEIVITRRGRPVARLMRAQAQKQPMDFAEADALRRRLPPSDIDSATLIRRMRDEGY